MTRWTDQVWHEPKDYGQELTCHDKNGFDPDLGFECTACGTTTDGYMTTTLDVGHEVQFGYCPGCGRKVVG